MKSEVEDVAINNLSSSPAAGAAAVLYALCRRSASLFIPIYLAAAAATHEYRVSHQLLRCIRVALKTE